MKENTSYLQNDQYLCSLVQQLGAAFGMMVVGVLAQSYTVSITWMVATVFLGLVVMLIWLLTNTTRS